MVLYSITLYLVFVAAGFPAGMMGIVWTQISQNLTVAAPYVSLLRAMTAVGGVTACILCGRSWKKKEKLLDLSLAGIGMEALGVIGFSLSRVFWNLLVWSLVLGLGYGVSMTLLSIVVIRSGQRRILICYSGAGAGSFAGAWLLSGAMTAAGSWRTGCQVLGIVQILVGTAAFLIRRMLMKGEEFKKKMKEKSKEADRTREALRNDAHPSPEDVRAAERRYLRSSAFACLAAFFTGVLLCCIVLWPQGFRAAETGAGEEMTGYGVLVVSIGLTAGCILAGMFRPGRKMLQITCIAALAVLLLAEQILIGRGGITDSGLLAFQLLEGAAAGPLFPSLLLLDDILLDREAETLLVSLFPAFALGSLIVVTPLTQALIGAGQTGCFPLWLLLIAAVTGTCLFLPELPGRRGKKKTK